MHTRPRHWLPWVLSVETARRHYSEVALIADSEGARSTHGRIEEVMRCDYPALYRRCVDHSKRASRGERAWQAL